MRSLLLVVLFAVSPQILHSQESCTYDRCALRVEVGNIVVGKDGAEKYRLRAFSTPRLEERLALSDSALTHYRVFTRNHVSGNVWSLIGGLTLGFGLVSGFDDTGVSTEVAIGATVVGTIATLIGSGKTRRAQNALSRSVWWYNRDLQR